MTGIVQVDYDGLTQVAARFSRQSDAVAALRSRLDRSAAELLGHGWSGRGSDAFAAEYPSISAALQRLEQVLQDAALLCAADIPDRYRIAEEEAAAPFQGSFSGAAAGATAVDGTAADSDRFADALSAFDQPTNFGDDVTLPQSMYLNNSSSMADLFRMNEQQYDAPAGELEQSLRIFQIGENRYLVSIMGTDNDYPFTLAGWRNNALSGIGIDSWYTDRIAEAVNQLPEGAHINLVGHSQGGHVANLIANRDDIGERFTVDSVTTFGSFSNTRINPAIDANGYHSFITADDWMNQADSSAVRAQRLFGDESDPRPFVNNQLLDHFAGGHSGYGDSEQLAAMRLPFAVDRFEPVAAHTIADSTFNSYWQPINTGMEAVGQTKDGMISSGRSVGNALRDLPGNLWDAGGTAVRSIGSLFD